MSYSHGVFLPGGGRADDEAAAALASAAGMAKYEAKLILASPVPKQVHAARSLEDADHFALCLVEAHFDPFIVRLEDLLRVRPERAESAIVTPDGMDLGPGCGLRADEVRLVVHGRILRTRDLKTHFMHADMGRVIGGEPAGSRRDGDQAEDILHLYGDHPRRAVEIRGASPLPALRSFFPRARYDDTLVRFPPAMDVDRVQAERTLGGLLHTRTRNNEDNLMRASFLIASAILRS